MDPRTRALSQLMGEVSALEQSLSNFEEELAAFEALDDDTPAASAQLATLRQTVTDLRRELSRKRTQLHELSDAGTGCARRNSNPFDRDWIEEEREE